MDEPNQASKATGLERFNRAAGVGLAVIPAGIGIAVLTQGKVLGGVLFLVTAVSVAVTFHLRAKVQAASRSGRVRRTPQMSVRPWLGSTSDSRLSPS